MLWSGPALVRHGSALLAVAVAALLRGGLVAWFGDGVPPFVTFFGAVAVTAALFGLGPGLVALAGSVGMIAVALLEPPVPAGELAAFLVFVATGVALSVIGGRLRTARSRERARAAALRRSRLLLSEAERLSHTGAWEWDPVSGAWTFSDEWLAIHGCPQPTLTGAELLAIAHPDDREAIARAFEDVRTGTAPYEIEHRIVRQSDGAVRIVRARGRYVREGGRVVRIYGFAQDVTDQRHAEAALRASEERFRALVTATSEVVYRVSADGRELRPVHGQDLLPGRAEAPGPGWETYVHPLDRAEVAARVREAVRTRTSFEAEHRVERADGRTGWVFSRAVPVIGADGAIREWFGAAADITARKLAQEALIELKDALERRVAERTGQLRALAGELVRAEQRERARLAGVLHDGLQQLLVAAKMQLARARRRPGDDGGTTEALEKAAQLVEQSIQASRSLAVELSPPILREAGIAAGLEWLARWMQDKHGLTVCVDVEGGVEADQELRTFLFEAVRELLLNVVKHGGTDEAVVYLQPVDGNLRARVEDRGRGFDPAAPPAHEGHARGTGLTGLRQRARVMGGRLDVWSAPGQGTRVDLQVPLQAPERPSEGATAVVGGGSGF